MNFQTVVSYTSSALHGAVLGGAVGASYGAYMGSLLEIKATAPGCLQVYPYPQTIPVYDASQSYELFIDECHPPTAYHPTSKYGMFICGAVGAAVGATVFVAQRALSDLTLYYGNKGELH